jgi:hypothetical protein
MGSSIDTSIDSIASVQGNARNISLFGFGFPRGFVNGGFSDSHVFLVGDDFSFNLYFTEIDGVITDFTPLFPGICLLNGGPGCFTITSASGTVIDPEVQTASLAAVPEPGSLLLLLAGFIGLGMTKQKTPALPGLSLRGGKSEGSC